MASKRALEHDEHDGGPHKRHKPTPMLAGGHCKYILVTGGVLSGVGKGVISSSIGVVLKSRGVAITHLKIDPYINIDAGTMSPAEHGECFVLDDGGEVDLDLGNYERFGDLTLTRHNSVTTGKIYQQVIEKERRGDYLGKTVQVVPHVTDAIQDWVQHVAELPVDGTERAPDVCIIELGGTVGDIESGPFVEAMRQFRQRVGHSHFMLVHVSLVPTVTGGEQKSKPTQHSIRTLMGLGLMPDILVCRSEQPLDDDSRGKLAMFCNVKAENVLSIYNVSNIYHVPQLLEAAGTTRHLMEHLHLSPTCVPLPRHTLDAWNAMAQKMDQFTEKVTIALVGKYLGKVSDAYHSVFKALEHAAFAAERKLDLLKIDSSHLEASTQTEDPEAHERAWTLLRSASGVFVPGGFGSRGWEGKILAANYARTNRVPYFGVCFGLQVAVTEFVRNVVGYPEANTEEIDENCPKPSVVFMPEVSKTHMGGTMRLGTRPTYIRDDKCLAARLYHGAQVVNERHRHRYEVNPTLVPEIEAHGMQFVGQDSEHKRMEIMELPDHPFYLAVQYHPEFLSRPLKPSPPYLGLMLAASGQLDRLPAVMAHHSPPR